MNEKITSTIYIDGKTSLNKKLFIENGIKFIDDPLVADYILVKSNIKNVDFIHKTIYVSREPQKEKNTTWCFKNFDKFKLVVAYNPDPNKKNQIAFNPKNVPNWVSIPSTKMIPIKRDNINLRNKGVFFAGNIKNHPPIDTSTGAISINHLRKTLGEYFIKNFKDTIVIGEGWKEQSRDLKNWRQDKQNRIQNSQTDFVLSLENTIYPNYMSEKFWDGLYSDKVTMYLGDPNINNFFSNKCYIDLRPYYDIHTGIFDIDLIGNFLNNMSQSQYNEIILNAREERQKYISLRTVYMNELTLQIINKIKEWKKV